jgi:hypothetical protein
VFLFFSHNEKHSIVVCAGGKTEGVYIKNMEDDEAFKKEGSEKRMRKVQKRDLFKWRMNQ